MAKIIIILISVILGLISCGESNEAKINKYADIYYEILKIREGNQDTAVGNPLVNKLLEKYGYSTESFQKASFELFDKDRTAFTKMIDSVRKKAEIELKANTTKSIPE